MLYDTLILLALYLFQGALLDFDWSVCYVGSLLYLMIPSSMIGFTAYLTLVGRMDPDRTAYCTVLFPVVALSISVLAKGYHQTVPALAGLVLVMLGNVLVFRKPKVPTLAGPVRST